MTPDITCAADCCWDCNTSAAYGLMEATILRIFTVQGNFEKWRELKVRKSEEILRSKVNATNVLVKLNQDVDDLRKKCSVNDQITVFSNY